MRTVEWNYDINKLQMIDQRLLPGELKVAVFDDYRAAAKAITDMVVRGAPAIGAAAAFGLALAAQQSNAVDYISMHADLKSCCRLSPRSPAHSRQPGLGAGSDFAQN